jgi:anhydro-N-acetylmuramic acid kinase
LPKKIDKLYRAIGLMSGTSVDGIDLALIESDGKNQITNHNFSYLAYDQNFKEKLRKLTYCASKKSQIDLIEIKLIENELTILHANLVNDFLAKNNLIPKDIDIIGFHGHTILHDPEKLITWQIGNGHLLASKTKIDVIADFRSKDVANGGHGAPLVPIYHFYLLKNQFNPAAILNIGGISNISYFNGEDENKIEAFDICFGNAPFDDLVKKKIGIDFDENGQIAIKGKIDFKLSKEILTSNIFNQKPPKSFHRQDFKHILAKLDNLEISDALATLAHIHAETLKINLKFLSNKPEKIFIAGGGRKNPVIIAELKNSLKAEKITIGLIDKIGLNGDVTEAEAFAFLAIRSLKNLPISFTKTTGISTGNNSTNSNSCLGGGVLYKNQ